ncbi:hypothetical protein [Microlunatus flavus]|uniref:Uncharacterized protein n=1 Tax=Microlunatus flavus TaxID=1036181 RepID=A0A1H9FN56_9ACTN|nr:hypothetical protein [Microlunatus flavus]SEQ39391.1 hypothetical protein SAMN05421756_103328 [Microlunatus flavus]
MKRLLGVVLAGLAVSAVAAGPAQAVGRPTDGCSRGYALTAVSVLQDLAQQTPDAFFVEMDENGDGYLCNKFLPDAATNVGVIHDNHVAGH